ncbi:MAG TPA: hypothetical protein PK760_11635, partial [Flavobacteriales bacterium]|nr:hypothetical protein [Flavobacteriales bacterium]
CTATPPSNDDCAGAIALDPGFVCTATNGTTAGANTSGGSASGAGCNGGNASDDVWFSFVASNATQAVIVDPSDNFDAVIEVFANDCNIGSRIVCRDAGGSNGTETASLIGLTVGATYYVRVYDWYAGYARTPEFTICVTIPCAATAGALSADASPVCLDNGSATISATPDGNAVIPSGYEVAYLLIQDGTIHETSSTPLFNVVATDPYWILTLVYDPNTIDLSTLTLGVSTAADVNILLVQGGGSNCGALDLVGATFDVIECTVCDATAGALVADASPVCLDNGSATISATPDGNAVVPVGYQVVYVLSQGAGLVIQDTSLTASFTVNAADLYTIHTLVYDPNTLDLSALDFGTTTGADVNGLLVQGGGSICAALDVNGAAIDVQNCIICDADAGTVTADASSVCLVNGAAQIGVTPDGNAAVPSGFETAFVLTQGPGLVIVGLDVAPVFNVTSTGAYTIHTFVYDPLTIDVSLIELGVTTGFDVNALLVQGGGTICGSLDVVGAPIE